MDTDADTVTFVTAEEAAHLAGVSARTVRRWIRNGWLPGVDGPHGRLVSPGDLPAARAIATQGRGRNLHARPLGHGHGREDTVTVADAVTTAALVSDQARAQLEAIRDEWLRPLVERNEELARVNGRLEERLAAAERERDELAAQLRAAQEAHVASRARPGAAAGADAGSDASAPAGSTSRPWWRRWLGL